MIGVAPFTPDRPAFNGGTTEALNVIAARGSYRPFPAFQAFSTAALTARAQGGFFARNPDGTGSLFAGDATKLYLVAAGSATDVSRLAGGAYATPPDGRWVFLQFGSIIIALNGIDVPQAYTLGSSTNFAALGGSPQTAVYGTVAGDFVFLGQTAADRQDVIWSAINNATSWAASATTQADSQTLPDGGWVQGMVGYERACIIFQEFAIRRAEYVGPPLIWSFSKITENLGTPIPGSICAHEDMIFFVDRSGFFALQGGSQLIPIGETRVNRFFWADVDQANLHRITSGFDSVNGLYCISYPSTTASNGTPDSLLTFQHDIGMASDFGWTRVEPGEHEMLFSGATQTGFDMDSAGAAGMDQFGDMDSMVQISMDSQVWSGVARRLLSGFSTDHLLGYFQGANLAWTVDTIEAELSPGRLSFVRSARPVVDGGTPSLALRYRNRINDAVTTGTAVAQDSLGKCDFRLQARYLGARATGPAGQTWSHFSGVDDIRMRPTGRMR